MASWMTGNSEKLLEIAQKWAKMELICAVWCPRNSLLQDLFWYCVSGIFFQKIPLSFRMWEFLLWGHSRERTDWGVFKGAHLCPALNTPFWLMAHRNYFCATWKVLIQEVLFQWRVKTLSMKERFSGTGVLLPLGVQFFW